MILLYLPFAIDATNHACSPMNSKIVLGSLGAALAKMPHIGRNKQDRKPIDQRNFQDGGAKVGTLTAGLDSGDRFTFKFVLSFLTGTSVTASTFLLTIR